MSASERPLGSGGAVWTSKRWGVPQGLWTGPLKVTVDSNPRALNEGHSFGGEAHSAGLEVGGACLDWDSDGQVLGLGDPKEPRGHTHRRSVQRKQDTLRAPAVSVGHRLLRSGRRLGGGDEGGW